MFEIKRFNSGELDVKLTERLSEFTVHWNWFNEDERDLMVPLMKADAIKRQYGDVQITLNCPYLPYSRQDRVFNIGQGIPYQLLLEILFTRFYEIKVWGLHTKPLHKISNKRIDINNLSHLPHCNILAFPDKNARSHFRAPLKYISFDKIRTENGVSLEINKNGINHGIKFLICDDICDGGRTFIECANILQENYGDSIKIELMIYHGFMTYGLDNLKASGISKIYIINPDSYEYLIKKFPNDVNYFEKVYINV